MECPAYFGNGSSRKPLQLGLLNAQSVNNKALFIKDYLVDNCFELLAIVNGNRDKV